MEPKPQPRPAARPGPDDEPSGPGDSTDAAEPVSTERPSGSDAGDDSPAPSAPDERSSDSAPDAAPEASKPTEEAPKTAKEAPKTAEKAPNTTEEPSPPSPAVPQATPSAPGSRPGPSEAPHKPPSSSTVRTKPVLASEALRDDLAPLDPLASAVRIWSAAAGATFIALAFLPASLAGVPGSHAGYTSAHFGLGVLTVAVAALPLRYAWRAAVLVFVAVACGLLGIAGHGPCAALAAITGEWGLLHLLAGLGLPAALLFRARYRAFAGARVVLLAALVLTLPYAGYAAWAAADGATLAVQVVSAAAVLVVLLSLLGFMGPETTGGGNATATFQTIAVTAQLAASLAGLIDLGRQPLWGAGAFGSVAAFGAAIVIGSLGTFQLLAWRLGPQARSVDTSARLPAERPRKHSVVDWLTRG